MKIIRGKQPGAKKVVIYGPEGIGKSTFASKFPDPLFIDTEGSTKEMDVARTEKPTSWTMLQSQIDEVIKTPALCRTLVVDTLDWAEQLCIQHICDKHDKSGIESFGYGNGYVYVKEEFGRFLNKLEDVISVGINVVLTAHAQLRKFEQPDEMGSYDRWELKLGKKTASQTSPLVKEWSDLLLFANYKTFVVAVDDKGKKHKAQGGKRVMYTTHHSCWDAKNRYGLADELPLEYEQIAQIIEPGHSSQKEKPVQAAVSNKNNKGLSASKPIADERPGSDFMKYPEDMDEEVPYPPDEEPKENPPDPLPDTSVFKVSSRVPKPLRDLMEDKLVSEEEIRKVVAQRGYYPESTAIERYDPAFISGVLVGAWDQVYGMIRKLRESYDVPFD